MPHTKEQKLIYSRTKEGLIKSIYYDQRSHSLNRKHPMPEYSKEELIVWTFSQSNFDKLYENWVESGYKKDLRPSVDRKDDYVHYKLENLQLVTFRENYKRSHEDMKNGTNNKQSKTVYQYDLEGNFIKEFHSCRFAGRELNLSPTSIGRVCNYNQKTAGGFIWSYTKLVEINNTGIYLNDSLKFPECSELGLQYR